MPALPENIYARFRNEYQIYSCGKSERTNKILNLYIPSYLDGTVTRKEHFCSLLKTNQSFRIVLETPENALFFFQTSL